MLSRFYGFLGSLYEKWIFYLPIDGVRTSYFPIDGLRKTYRLGFVRKHFWEPIVLEETGFKIVGVIFLMLSVVETIWL